jgi:large subunit ribosomal protein L18
MSKTNERVVARLRRKAHVRKKVDGDADRPRLVVYRSNSHIYAQIVDDTLGKTLVAASTLSEEVKGAIADLDKKGAASLVGKAVAARAKAAGVEKVVFDRNGFRYHGRIAALADGAREGGLDF